ncbi:MAG TPA: L,D-transpeptidase family protein [Candidatus Paceibacterota bacterium]
MAEREAEHKNLFSYTVPIWVLLFVVLASIGAAAWSLTHLRNPVYNYELEAPLADSPGKIALAYGSSPALAEPDFFASVERQFIAEEVSFVSTDLADMKVSVYKDGKLVKEVPILSKGREGSWWETPAGLYKIESKEPSHYSSFGHVYQPWSMAFQGNFFIHGWPHYEDGSPVAAGYSGGCVRLSTEDAKAVYDLVEVGMPVLVFERDYAPDGAGFESKQPTFAPDNYLVADLSSNFVFARRAPQKEAPIASITKLMTALVAAEYINLDADITITSSMLATTSVPRLVAGTRVSAYQLLYLLLLESSNEAAEAYARHVGRNYFVSLMNKKAAAIGMSHTHFVDPSGADEGNVSTTEDLFALAKYISNNRSFVLGISSGRIQTSAYGESQFKNLKNFNDFAGTATFAGGKVGKTIAAGETGLYLFDITIGESKRRIAVILLGSQDRKKDAQELLDFVRENFQ